MVSVSAHAHTGALTLPMETLHIGCFKKHTITWRRPGERQSGINNVLSQSLSRKCNRIAEQRWSWSLQYFVMRLLNVSALYSSHRKTMLHNLNSTESTNETKLYCISFVLYNLRSNAAMSYKITSLWCFADQLNHSKLIKTYLSLLFKLAQARLAIDIDFDYWIVFHLDFPWKHFFLNPSIPYPLPQGMQRAIAGLHCCETDFFKLSKAKWSFSFATI